MSDGLSESRREERLIRDAARVLDHLRDVLEDAHDAAFGLPTWIVDDLDEVLRPFGRVTTRAPFPALPDQSNGES